MMTRNRFYLGSGNGAADEAPFEDDKPPVLLLSVLLFLLVVILLVVGLVAGEILRWVNDYHTAESIRTAQNLPLSEQQALDKARLSDYSKQESGAFAVPIDRAKELLLQRGSAAPLK